MLVVLQPRQSVHATGLQDLGGPPPSLLSLRVAAATDALEHEVDIAEMQEWLGHSNIATTRLYGRRHTFASTGGSSSAGVVLNASGSAP